MIAGWETQLYFWMLSDISISNTREFAFYLMQSESFDNSDLLYFPFFLLFIYFQMKRFWSAIFESYVTFAEFTFSKIVP